MRQSGRIMVGLIGGAVVLVGCRMATRVVEVPRVDLELAGGNRGYLVGGPPEAAGWKTTREMVQTDVEIPSLYRPKRAGSGAGLEELVPPELDAGQTASDGAGAGQVAAGRDDVYTVQKGDSLWSIAAKPDIYGQATHWRRLLKANREVLGGKPERLREGMKLSIPRGAFESRSTVAYEDEGLTFKK